MRQILISTQKIEQRGTRINDVEFTDGGGAEIIRPMCRNWRPGSDVIRPRVAGRVSREAR